MKKIIAVAVALILAMSTMLALAEAPAAGATVDCAITIDPVAAKALLAGVDETTADAVLALVNAAQTHVVVDGKGGEMVIAMGGEDVVSIGTQTEGDQLRLASSLIPSYILTVDAQTLMGMMAPALNNSGIPLENLDGLKIPDEVKAAVMEHLQPFPMSMMRALDIGDPEEGDFTEEVKAAFPDTQSTFTTKTPMTVDMAAVTAAVKTLLQDLNGDQTVMDFFGPYLKDRNGNPVDLNEIADSLPTENLPNVNIYAYAEEGSASAMLIDVLPQGAEAPVATVDLLLDQAGLTGQAYIPAQSLTVAFKGEMEGGKYYGQADITSGQSYFGLDVAVDPTNGDPVDISGNLYLMDTQAPFVTFQASVSTVAGERTLDLNDPAKTVLSLEKIMSGEESTSGLMMDFMISGLSGTLSKITAAVPEAAGLLSALGMGDVA